MKGSTSFRKYKHKNLQACPQYAPTTNGNFIIRSGFKPAVSFKSNYIWIPTIPYETPFSFQINLHLNNISYNDKYNFTE